MKNGKTNKSGLFGRFARYCMEQVLSHELFLPIVDAGGDVKGKILAVDAFLPTNRQMLPMVRVAVTLNGMLYLRHRPQGSHFEVGKADLPIEGYLVFKEPLEKGVQRIIQKTFPHAPNRRLYFNLMYLYEDKTIKRLVYLYTLDLEDESLLNGRKEGKLWTLPQIEHNLNKRFFSVFFENEYATLKQIICIREKYKES